MQATITGPASMKALRQAGSPSGRRSFSPLMNSDTSTATSARCTSQSAMWMKSICQKPIPSPPISAPKPR